jgi:hypothetical protein
MLGLAMVAAIAAMAFVGAGSASAAVSLCKVNESPCKEANRIAAGTEIASELAEGEAVLTGAITIKCKKSTVKGKVTRNNGTENPLGEITSATWTECVNGSGTKCTVTALHLNWKAEITENVAHTNNMKVTGISNGNPGAEVKGCVPFTCTVTAAEVNLKIQDSSLFANGPARIFAEKEPFAGTCGNTTWTATYKITTPNPLYIT